MKKILFIFILILFSAKLFALDLQINAEQYIKYKSDNILFIDSKLISVFQNQKSLVLHNFYYNDNYQDLELSRTKSVVNNKTIFLDGSGMILKNPKVITYQGNIKGNPESDVIITIVNDLIFLSLKNNDRDIFIYPSQTQLGLYAVKDLIGNPLPMLNPNDVIEDPEQISIIREKTNRKLENDSKLLELELAVETDTEVFKATGGTLEKTQAYTIALYDRVSKIYEQFANIALTLSWVKTWTDNPTDPYTAGGDPFVLRDKALPYWDQNYKSVPRDCYQVITSISYGGGGFGYFNGLCNNNYYGMSSVSWQGWNDLKSNNFNYDIYITAHELGHNLNAQHTHSCFWDNAPLDTCIVNSENQDCLPAGQQPKPAPGSIMSYCGGINNSSGYGYYVRMIFEPRNISIMRKTAEASDCITEYKGKLLYITEPNGKSAYSALDSMTIKWYSNGINKVNIKYRLGKNSNWIIIDKEILATTEKYTWQIPNICTNNLEIGLFDSSDETQFDIINKTLTVNNQIDHGMVLYIPFDDDKIQGGEDYTYCNFYDINEIYDRDFDKFNTKKSSAVFNGSSYLTTNYSNPNFHQLSVALWFNFSDGTDKHNIFGTNWEVQPLFETYIWNNMLGVSLYILNNSVPKQLWHPYYLNPNQWYFLTFIADGKTIKLYLDGTLSQILDLTSYDINQLSNALLYYGSRGENEKYSGKLDEVHLYNRALNDQEVSDLYNMNKNNKITDFSPAEGASIASHNYKLTWSKVPNATRYIIEIKKHADGKTDEYLLDKNLFVNEYNFTDTVYTNFKWRIAALINDTKTEFSDYKSFTYSSASVRDTKNEIKIECQPNPAINVAELNIYIPDQSIRNITIYNSLGKAVKQIFNGFKREYYEEKIDVDFENGYYFIAVQTDSKRYYKTLVIVK